MRCCSARYTRSVLPPTSGLMDVSGGGPSAGGGTTNSRRSRSHAASTSNGISNSEAARPPPDHRLFREREDIQHSTRGGLLLEFGGHVSKPLGGGGVTWIQVTRDDAAHP